MFFLFFSIEKTHNGLIIIMIELIRNEWTIIIILRHACMQRIILLYISVCLRSKWNLWSIVQTMMKEYLSIIHVFYFSLVKMLPLAKFCTIYSGWQWKQQQQKQQWQESDGIELTNLKLYMYIGCWLLIIII